MSRTDNSSSTATLHAVPQKPSPADERKRRGTRAYLALAALAVLVAAGAGGYLYWTSGTQSTDDAVVEADVVSVSARIGGVIAHLNVRENQAVKKGDLLLTIDDADLTAKVAQA